MIPFPIVLAIALTLGQTKRPAPFAQLEAYGDVLIGQVKMPTGATVFEGQTVSTTTASKAQITTIKDKTALVLGNLSRASFSSTAIRLQSGVGRFIAKPQIQTPLYVLELSLKPTSAAATIDCTIADTEITVAAVEGSVTVVDPTGVSLKTLAKGEAFKFARRMPRSGGLAPGMGGLVLAAVAAMNSTECRVPEARVSGAIARDGAFDSRAAFPGDAAAGWMPNRKAIKPPRGVGYRLSVAALLAANALDTASSWGRYELNPALGRGPFGARQVGIKFGLTAGSLGAQRLLLRRSNGPKYRRVLFVLNFAQAAALGAVAGRNWTR